MNLYLIGAGILLLIILNIFLIKKLLKRNNYQRLTSKKVSKTPKIYQKYNQTVITKNKELYGYSYIGNREYQQDNFSIVESNYGQILTVLCDGMGGMEDGDVASGAGVEYLCDVFMNSETKVNPYNFYKTVILKIDDKIAKFENKQGYNLDTGTTLVSVILDNDNMYWASVGDSRIYIVKNNSLIQISEDHTYELELTKMVQTGEINKEQAKNHPQKGALISYIGMGGIDVLDISTKPISLESGDLVLLCSDGVTNTLSEKEILEELLKIDYSVKRIVDSIIESIKEKAIPNQDNATVIIMRV